MTITSKTWTELIGSTKEKPYFKDILKKVAEERAKYVIYPQKEEVFNAFRYTGFADLKMVILGQDPYHGEGQAHGLAFSVQPNVPVPPSLQNIYKELQSDVDFKIPTHGCLNAWAKEGIFLLNTVLTVRAGNPQSHQDLGWQRFTDEVIDAINSHKQKVVFLLWGSAAKQKAQRINPNKHLILTAAHPSPLSAYRGFFGCRHFSKANDFLRQHHLKPVNWQL